MAPKSDAAKARRAAKKGKKGGKAGCQGNFLGMREQFVVAKFPSYLGIKGTPRGLQMKYWNQTFADYWATFQWNLPPDMDPDPSFPPPPEETPEILEQKNKIIKLTQARLKAHFRYRAAAAARKEHNPWEDIIASILNDLEESTPPRKLPLWQFYMSAKPDQLSAEVDIRWAEANLPENDLVAFRGRIARELLAQESQEYRDELQQECDKQHELDEKAYEAAEAAKGSLSDDEATREKARQNFTLIVQPLLELLRRYTGFYISMIAGVPLTEGDKEFELKSMSAGKASGGRTWHGVEGTHFQHEVMPSFTRFLMATPEYQERLKTLGGSSSESDPSPPSASTMTSPTQSMTSPTQSMTAATTSEAAVNAAAKTTSKTSKKRKGKARCIADDSESDSATESESSDSDSDSDDDTGTKKNWEGGDDEDDEAEGEGEGEGEEDEAENEVRATIPDNEEVPTADDLGLNDAMKRKLEAMPEDERRVWLWVHRNTSKYDLDCLNTRASNDEILTALGLDSNFLAKKQPKKRVQPKAKKAGATSASSQQPTLMVSQLSTGARRSARLDRTKDSSDSTSGVANPGVTTAALASSDAANSSTVNLGDTTSGVAHAGVANTGDTTSGVANTGDTTSGVANAGSTTLGDTNTGSAAPDGTTSSIVNTGRANPRGTTDSIDFDIEKTGFENSELENQVSANTAVSKNVVGNIGNTTTAGREGWPSWVSEAFEFFFKSWSYGGEFGRAVLNWTRLEREYGFETSNKGLPAKQRPEAVAHWIRVGRRALDKTPPMPSEDVYSSSWWDWWAGFQPEWRMRDASGRPIIGGEGEWDELRYPSKNGMLIVLLSLWWWRGIAVASLDEWNVAVRDVCWVLEKMAAAPPSGPPAALKRSANEQAGPASGKRARR